MVKESRIQIFHADIVSLEFQCKNVLSLHSPPKCKAVSDEHTEMCLQHQKAVSYHMQQFCARKCAKLHTISEKAMAPHSSTLAWKILWTEEPGGLQSMGSLRVGHDWATSLSLFTFHFHALEKEIPTHSSVLAWRIPGTGEPGGLPSMGSYRVGHDWNDLTATAATQYSPGHCSLSPSILSLQP